eukprot:c20180_g1_i1 orf=67-4089(+)
MPALPALPAMAMAKPLSSSSGQPPSSIANSKEAHPPQTCASCTIADKLAHRALCTRRASSFAGRIFCSTQDPRHEHCHSEGISCSTQGPRHEHHHSEELMRVCNALDSESSLNMLPFPENGDEEYALQNRHEGDARVSPFSSSTKQEESHTHMQAIQYETVTRQSIINRLSRSTSNLAEGMLLHGLIIEIGFELDTFEANILVHMYGKSGTLDDACSVFDRMQQRDVVTWNTMISACVHHKCYSEALEFFAKMHQEGYLPDSITIKISLRCCVGLAALLEGQLIHHLVVVDGLETETSIGASLVDMYGRCGALKEARCLFDNMPERDELTWTAMITTCFNQGCDQDILQLYRQMQQEKRVLNKVIFVTALKACTNLADLAQGKLIHKYMAETAFVPDDELTSVLVTMYGQCGALDLAGSVFENSCPHTLASYNAMIATYLFQAQHKQAFQLFQQMLVDGLMPDAATYSKAVQVCESYNALEDVRALHSYVTKSGLDSDVMMGTALVSMYGKCGEIADVRLILSQMNEHNLLTWNALLAACVQHRHSHECIQIFKEMLLEGVYPSKETFSYVLPSCAHLGVLADGKMIHACVVQAGLDMDAAMASSLISMYGKCGALNDARCVFDKIPDSNVIHWTSMIAVYVQHGKARDALQLFDKMQQGRVKPNSITFTNVLNACASLGALTEGQTVHACIKDCDLKTDVGLANALLHMYCKCGALTDAHLVFDNMFPKKAVSWNVLIAAYIQQGHNEVAMQLFQQMQQENVEADEITFVNVLRACARLDILHIGNAIHCCVVQRGLGSSIVFATTLISMYGACGALEEAQWVFNKIEEHNMVSWTAIITVHVQQGCGQEAIELFHQMRVEGWEPDGVTLVSVLGAYANLKLTAPDDVIQACYRCNFKADIVLGNALINMYAKCGAVENARMIFEKMHDRNVATWNAMISAYGQHAYGKEALELLQRAHQEGISPDELTWIHCLSICGALGALGQGKVIHKRIIDCGYEANTGLGNALVNMYGKCGAMEEAVSVFNNVKRDVVSWNAILAAFSQHGRAKEAVQLFRQMQLEGTKPDEVTFLSVLNACSHAGLVEEGCEFFIWMRENQRMVLTTGHYGCLIDLFGKSGHLDVAEDLICTVPVHSTALLWMTLLSACRNHGDVKRGERALDYVAHLDPGNGAAPYVLLSNVYATHGRWDDVKMLRELMLKRAVQKRPGCSMIEVNNKIHSFLPRDRRHPDRHVIYEKLESLNRQLEHRGYVPNTTLSLHDVDEESKKFLLCHHSERLALAFGLIKTTSKEPLLIVKNLRMCADCHTAFKFLSTIVDRKITLRDVSRFHCFKDGLCSCGDYW